MSKIKLEIGKTYRNWRGEDVTIVEYDGDSGDLHRYKGSNGQWYTKDGRFNYFLEDSLYDLVEEVKERK